MRRVENHLLDSDFEHSYKQRGPFSAQLEGNCTKGARMLTLSQKFRSFVKLRENE